MNQNILLIGGDGDLAMRKLYPALYALEAADQLSGVESITGLSRALEDREQLLEKMLPWLQALESFNEQAWQRFQARITCLQGDATQASTLLQYKDQLDDDNPNVIVYLAVPPKVFGGACRALKESGLAIPSTRLVVEKPLGSDLESFMSVNAEMRATFEESQIYRIDH